MDNKVTKKRINDHLEYDWYKYLIILVAGIVLFVFAFSQINATRDYENVAFFVSCYDSADSKLEDKILTEMSSAFYAENHGGKYGENVLREISFETTDPLSDEYGTLYQTHGLISSDVLIIGKSIIEKSSGFLELTDSLLNDYILPKNMTSGNEVNKEIDDFEYIEDSKGVRVGIKISGLGGTGGNGSSGAIFQMNWRNVEKYKDAFSEAGEGELPDDEFYIVINPKSVSIGKFGLGKSKPQNAQALYAVNRLIEYML